MSAFTTPCSKEIQGVSLFSGAGGMDEGFAQAGIKAVVACEMESHACRSFRANHPAVELHEARVETVDWSRWRGVDVVFGGPPCQPFSAAGQGRGQYDPRDGMPHFIEVVRQVEPRAFVFENVEALTFAAHAPYLGQVLTDLAELGYAVAHNVLNAAFHAVPQVRHRLIVVGIRTGKAELAPFGHGLPAQGFAWPEATHGDPRDLVTDGLFSDPRLPWLTVRQALGLRIELRPNRDHREGRPPTSWDMDDRPSSAVVGFGDTLFEVPVETAGEATFERVEGRYMRLARGPETSNMPVYETDRPSVPITASAVPSLADDLAAFPIAEQRRAGAAVDPDQGELDVHELEAELQEAELVRFDHEGLEPVDPDEPALTVRPGPNKTRWGDLMVRRNRGASQVRPDHSVDGPAPTVMASMADGGGNGLFLVDEGREMADPRRVIDDPDAPSPTILAAGADNRPGKGDNGGNPPYLELPDGAVVRHRSNSANDGKPSTPASLDGPSPSVSTKGTLYFEPPAEGQLELLIRDEDPKHPASRLDEPAKSITSGGDGHSNHDHLVEVRPPCVCGCGADDHALEVITDSPHTMAEVCQACDCEEYRPAAEGLNGVLDEPAPTISTGGEYGGRGVIAKGKRDELYDAVAATRADLIASGELDPHAAYGRKAAGGLHKGERIVDPDAPSQAMQSAPGGQDFVRGLVDDGAPSPTVTAHAEEPVGQGSRQATKRGYYRRLTPVECAILQAFRPFCPHPEHGYREGAPYIFTGPKSAVYRQVGNAIPPPLARAVAAQLRAALEKEN